VQDSLYTAGRRGVGATVLAEKICGAAAEAGRSLSEVAELCRKLVDGGAPGIHFYTLNRARATLAVWQRLQA